MPHETAQSSTDRWTLAALWMAVGGLFLVHLCGLTFVDPDLFHEMSLARELFADGTLPFDDRFAYTPTIEPSVHHEWGTGVILYVVSSLGGAPALLGLKYGLSVLVVGLCLRCAWRQGASGALTALVCALPIMAGCIGFTTIRAQLFTMAALALLLNFLESDRRGDRRWMVAWIPLYIVWLNLHAGFVVGAGLIGVHALEQGLRGEKWRHLALLSLINGALVIVNPYGWLYYPYLAHGLLLPRPMIIEWRPLWQVEPAALFQTYLLSVVIALYGFAQLGWRRTAGALVLLICAVAAAKHTRHVALYWVVWLSTVPAWLEGSRLGSLWHALWQRHRRWGACVCGAIAVLALVRAVPAEPWRLRLPTTAAEEATGRPMYPTGPVEFLRLIDFRGNMMVPFVPGGFVSWKLHPHVKVSLDGRYEVAYVPGTLEENEAFYQGEVGWERTLSKYPTDLVLVPRSTPLAKNLPSVAGWTRVYRDASFELWSRPGLELPAAVDVGPITLPGSFP